VLKYTIAFLLGLSVAAAGCIGSDNSQEKISEEHLTPAGNILEYTPTATPTEKLVEYNPAETITPAKIEDSLKTAEELATEPGFIIQKNKYTITSYCNDNEALYGGEKQEVFDSRGKSLGFYKSKFLDQIKIDGSGQGDGVQNDGRALHYDYGVGDKETYYLVDKSLGAWDNGLVDWKGDKPSLAVNPPLPHGTQIRFIDLGHESDENPEWVNELLKTTTFYADDKFYGFGPEEYKIDVYTGLQKNLGYDNPESLWMHDVEIAIKPAGK